MICVKWTGMEFIKKAILSNLTRQLLSVLQRTINTGQRQGAARMHRWTGRRAWTELKAAWNSSTELHTIHRVPCRCHSVSHKDQITWTNSSTNQPTQSAFYQLKGEMKSKPLYQLRSWEIWGKSSDCGQLVKPMPWQMGTEETAFSVTKPIPLYSRLTLLPCQA